MTPKRVSGTDREVVRAVVEQLVPEYWQVLATHKPDCLAYQFVVVQLKLAGMTPDDLDTLMAEAIADDLF